MLNQKRSRRVKGAGFLDFFNGISSKVGSFIKSPTVQSIRTTVSNFASTDVGKAVVSAGKDIAIAGATGAKDAIVEKIKNASAKKQDKEASQALSQYLAQSIAANAGNLKTNQDLSNFMQSELSNVLGTQPTVIAAPTQVTRTNVTPTQVQRPLQDTYGYGVNVKKLNKLIKEVSGKGLVKLN